MFFLILLVSSLLPLPEEKKNIADMSRQIIQVSEMFGNYIIQSIIHTSFSFFPPTGRRRCIVLQFKHSDENSFPFDPEQFINDFTSKPFSDLIAATLIILKIILLQFLWMAGRLKSTVKQKSY